MTITLRVILTLKSITDFAPNFVYHSSVQGFIYSLLRNTSFESLHDKKGFKFFSFSNIFSVIGNPDNRLFNLIISSPSEKFVNELSYQLQRIIEIELPIEIGSLFELKNFDLFHTNNLILPLAIITQSPILLRIQPSRFKQESSNSAPYRYIYWRSSHPVNIFIDALESNMKRKYASFTGTTPTTFGRIFEHFEFKKQVSTKISVHDQWVPVIGTLWKFIFDNSVSKDLQLFALDCGLGERNSFGFGFVNPLKEKQVN